MANKSRPSRPDTYTESQPLSCNEPATDSESYYTYTHGLCSPDSYSDTKGNHTNPHGKGHHPDAYDKPSTHGKHSPDSNAKPDTGGNQDAYTIAYPGNRRFSVSEHLSG